MDVYRGHQTALSIALSGNQYFNITMQHYRGLQTLFTIALPGGLYLALIIDR
jgi:hypothetical protein